MIYIVRANYQRVIADISGRKFDDTCWISSSIANKTYSAGVVCNTARRSEDETDLRGLFYRDVALGIHKNGIAAIHKAARIHCFNGWKAWLDNVHDSSGDAHFRCCGCRPCGGGAQPRKRKRFL